MNTFKDEQGQAMVEFLLVVVIVMGMIFGLISLCMLSLSEEVLNNSAFVAARAASVGKSAKEAEAAACLSAIPILPFCRRSPYEIWGNTAELQTALNTINALAGNPSILTNQALDWTNKIAQQQFHELMHTTLRGQIYKKVEPYTSRLKNLPWAGDILYGGVGAGINWVFNQVESRAEDFIEPRVERTFDWIKKETGYYAQELYADYMPSQYQQFFQQVQYYTNQAVNFRSVPNLQVSINRYQRGEWCNRTRMVYSKVNGLINCFGGREVIVTGRLLDETNNIVIYNPLIMASGLTQISSWEEAKTTVAGLYHAFEKETKNFFTDKGKELLDRIHTWLEI